MSYPEGPYGGQWLPPPTPYDYQQQAPRRSSIPTVVGIIAIILASLGLLVTLVALLAADKMISKGDLAALGEAGKSFQTYNLIEQMTYLLIGGLHLVAGVMCVMRKRAAPALAVTYAVLKIAAVVAIFVLVYTWLAPALDDAPPEIRRTFKAQLTMQLVMGGILNMAWPIVMWVLMTRPAARAACDR